MPYAGRGQLAEADSDAVSEAPDWTESPVPVFIASGSTPTVFPS